MSIFKKYFWVIILITSVGLISALVFSFVKSAYYDTSISFSINRINQQETPEYQYDGYYSIQASDLFSQTVMSWFLTPSVLLEIYEEAVIDPQISSIEEISSRFKTKKFSPQNIVVRFKEKDNQRAEKLSAAIIKIIQDKSIESNRTSSQKALFEVIGNKPVIVERTPIIWLNSLIGLIAGFIFSVVVVYIIDYLRQEDAR